MTWYTKAQALRLLYIWGYTYGTLPQSHRPQSIVSIAAHLRTGTETRAVVSYGLVNGSGQRLYGVRFID